MENASKALIIAGAILISILIISLGAYFYSTAASSAKKADLSSTEAQAQNGQFESYFGNKRTASEVKSLMSLVRTNNLTGANSDDTRYIGVFFKGGKITAYQRMDPAKISQQVTTGKTYNINTLNSNFDDDSETQDAIDKLTMTSDTDAPAAYYKNGYIKIITITEN